MSLTSSVILHGTANALRFSTRSQPTDNFGTTKQRCDFNSSAVTIFSAFRKTAYTVRSDGPTVTEDFRPVTLISSLIAFLMTVE